MEIVNGIVFGNHEKRYAVRCAVNGVWQPYDIPRTKERALADIEEFKKHARISGITAWEMSEVRG